MEHWINLDPNIFMLVGRVCLATLFLLSALDKFRNSPPEVRAIASLHMPAPTLLVRVAGLCEGLGVIALLFGIYIRAAAALLALFIVVVSFLFLKFWSTQDPPEVKGQKRNAFFGNVAVVGGLIYVLAVGPGQYGLMQ
jgi:putative oxidoreductase